MREKVERLTLEMNEIAGEQQKLFQTAKGFEQTLAILEMKRQEGATKRSHIEEISQHMQFLEESDEELHNLQQQYSERLAAYVQHIQNKKNLLTKTKSNLEDKRSQLGAKLTEEGRVQAERTAYENQLQERESLVKDISHKLQLRGFDGQLDDEQILEFMSRVSKMSRDQNLVLERLKRDNEDKMATVQHAVNVLQNKKSSLQQEKEYAQSNIRDSDTKIKSLRWDLETLKVDAGQETLAQEDLNKRETRLENAKAEVVAADYEGSLRIHSEKLRNVEEQIEQVTQELYQGTRNADHRAQLAVLRQTVEARQKAFSSLYVLIPDAFEKSMLTVA